MTTAIVIVGCGEAFALGCPDAPAPFSFFGFGQSRAKCPTSSQLKRFTLLPAPFDSAPFPFPSFPFLPFPLPSLPFSPFLPFPLESFPFFPLPLANEARVSSVQKLLACFPDSFS